jgi:hypothetical protein
MLKGKAKILMFAACAESTLKRLNAVVRSILEGMIHLDHHCSGNL